MTACTQSSKQFNGAAEMDVKTTSNDALDDAELKWKNVNNRYPYRYQDEISRKTLLEAIESKFDPKYEIFLNQMKSIRENKKDRLTIWIMKTKKPDVIPRDVQHKYCSPGSFSIQGAAEYGSAYAIFCGYDRQKEMTLRALFMEIIDTMVIYIYHHRNPFDFDDLCVGGEIFALKCNYYVNKNKLILHKNLCVNGAFIKPKYFNDLTLK